MPVDSVVHCEKVTIVPESADDYEILVRYHYSYNNIDC